MEVRFFLLACLVGFGLWSLWSARKCCNLCCFLFCAFYFWNQSSQFQFLNSNFSIVSHFKFNRNFQFQAFQFFVQIFRSNFSDSIFPQQFSAAIFSSNFTQQFSAIFPQVFPQQFLNFSFFPFPQQISPIFRVTKFRNFSNFLNFG